MEARPASLCNVSRPGDHASRGTLRNDIRSLAPSHASKGKHDSITALSSWCRATQQWQLPGKHALLCNKSPAFKLGEGIQIYTYSSCHSCLLCPRVDAHPALHISSDDGQARDASDRPAKGSLQQKAKSYLMPH